MRAGADGTPTLLSGISVMVNEWVDLAALIDRDGHIHEL
jgi:hypothetical protein